VKSRSNVSFKREGLAGIIDGRKIQGGCTVGRELGMGRLGNCNLGKTMAWFYQTCGKAKREIIGEGDQGELTLLVERYT